MRTKIGVSLVVCGVCLFLGNSVFASNLGVWKGKITVYDTTCPSYHPNGSTEKAVLKINEISDAGRIKANVRYAGSDYKYKLRGRINDNKVKFHYVIWGDIKTYDLKGAIEGDLMKLHSFNKRSGTCDGGYYLKFKLKKQ